MISTRSAILRHFNRIVLVGVGGIGSWVIEPLVRMLITANYAGEFLILDDDKVETKNVGRQGFTPSDVGATKVGAWHNNRIKPLITNSEFRVTAHPIRLLENNVDVFVMENSLILLCPDNHAVRALVARRAEQLKNVIVLTAGNELFNGNVHVLVRLANDNLTSPMQEVHPEVFQANTESQMAACSDLIDKGNAQILMTNYMAATATLLAFHQLCTFMTPITEQHHVKEIPHEVHFNALTGKMRVAAYGLPMPILNPTTGGGEDQYKEVRRVLVNHRLFA